MSTQKKTPLSWLENKWALIGIALVYVGVIFCLGILIMRNKKGVSFKVFSAPASSKTLVPTLVVSPQSLKPTIPPQRLYEDYYKKSNYVINITDGGLQPTSLSAKQGETVEFFNESQHTVFLEAMGVRQSISPESRYVIEISERKGAHSYFLYSDQKQSDPTYELNVTIL